MHIYKCSEWVFNNKWHVGDVTDLANDSNAWWVPARFLNISLEEWIDQLVNVHKATIDKYCPDANNGKSLLIYHWNSYNDAHKYLLWINRMARNNSWTI